MVGTLSEIFMSEVKKSVVVRTMELGGCEGASNALGKDTDSLKVINHQSMAKCENRRMILAASKGNICSIRGQRTAWN